jgi:hypothetical protein
VIAHHARLGDLRQQLVRLPAEPNELALKLPDALCERLELVGA